MSEDLNRVMLDAMLFAMEGEDPSKAIELQEKREQRKVVANSRLPKKTNTHTVPEEIRMIGVTDSMEYEERSKIIDTNIAAFTKTQYERMGIKVIEECDDLFYSVELPEGWEIKATDHSMWNAVFDNKGRKRISFFYKGAFYDRDAFSNFECRYSYRIMPFDNYESDATYEERKSKPWTAYITDCGERILALKEISPDDYFAVDDILTKDAKKYLNKNYPFWEDINCYWD